MERTRQRKQACSCACHTSHNVVGSEHGEQEAARERAQRARQAGHDHVPGAGGALAAQHARYQRCGRVHDQQAQALRGVPALCPCRLLSLLRAGMELQ